MNFKKGMAYVFLATGIGFVINLITNFILPKFLSVETYADIKLYQLYITYVGILHFGFSDGMYLRLGGKKVNDINRKELISEFKTFKVFQTIIDIVAIVISLVIRDKILGILNPITIIIKIIKLEIRNVFFVNISLIVYEATIHKSLILLHLPFQ